MDREKQLRRIIGPLPYEAASLRWGFVSRRLPKFGCTSVQGRRFTLTYIPKTREFRATCTRRVSKRLKREPVKVSKGMTAYLKSRLLPQHVAACLAASLTLPR